MIEKGGVEDEREWRCGGMREGEVWRDEREGRCGGMRERGGVEGRQGRKEACFVELTVCFESSVVAAVNRKEAMQAPGHCICCY